MQNFVKFHPFIQKVLNRNEILTWVKGYNSDISLSNLTHNNPNLYLVNNKAYAKFVNSIHDIERNQNFDMSLF